VGILSCQRAGLEVGRVFPARKEVSAIFIKVFFNNQKLALCTFTDISHQTNAIDGAIAAAEKLFKFTFKK
jgi:hypothetical protein